MSDKETRGYKLVVTGDVQGVGYRHAAKQIAEKLELTGWAENLPDDGVEIVVEGKKDNVEQFIAWANEGSPMATVDNVGSNREAYTGEFEVFEIR